MTAAVRDPATWISRWAAAYHRPDDDPLAPLQGKAVLDAGDRQLLARWRFQHFPSRLRRRWICWLATTSAGPMTSPPGDGLQR